MGHLLRIQRRLPSGGRPLLLFPLHFVPLRYAASPSTWTPSRYASASGRSCTSPTVAKRALVDSDTENKAGRALIFSASPLRVALQDTRRTRLQSVLHLAPAGRIGRSTAAGGPTDRQPRLLLKGSGSDRRTRPAHHTGMTGRQPIRAAVCENRPRLGTTSDKANPSMRPFQLTTVLPASTPDLSDTTTPLITSGPILSTVDRMGPETLAWQRSGFVSHRTLGARPLVSP